MNFLGCIAVCLALQLAGAAAKGVSLPKEFQKCKRNDDACLKVAIQKVLPIFAKGLPKLGALPIDPLPVTEISIDQGTGPVSLKLNLQNQELLGIGHSIVNRVQSTMDDKTYRMEVDASVPLFKLLGDYTVSGRVLVLPLQGHGKNNLTLTNLSVKLTSMGHVVQRDGEAFLDLDKLVFRFDTERLYIDLENLFNGNKEVGDNMIVFLNENWRIVLDEVKPGIEEALSAVFHEIIRRIYAKVPYEVLHPKTL